MKQTILSVLAAGLGLVTSVNAAMTIPAPFRGHWSSNCEQARNPQDTEAAMSIVRVDTTSVSYGEAQCTLIKTHASDAFNLGGTFDCVGDGVGGKEALDLRLKSGKLRLIDGAGNIWQSTDELSHCK
jgi:hypothetical protein